MDGQPQGSPDLQTTVDKFTFRVPGDRRYSPDGLWVLPGPGGDRVRVGLSDYLQQHSGDLAFAEAARPGTTLAAGDELGTVETIKTTLVLPSPVDGVVEAVNPDLRTGPEVVNRDPYGAGWIAEIRVALPAAQMARLMTPAAYLAQVERQARAEVDGA